MDSESKCELIALCLCIIGLIGTTAVTALPMWRVSAYIGANIIVMETCWEGLWMNCFRQANFRMQCKDYDSLLYLPPEMQAARGLMCCAVALSATGLLVSIVGLRSTACLQNNPGVKKTILIISGVLEILACVCVLFPVSWTAHNIIADFYNPTLIDAERRELGQALYIGWVTGGVLFASGVLFLYCRETDSDSLYAHLNMSPAFSRPSTTPLPLHGYGFDPTFLCREQPLTTRPLVYSQNINTLQNQSANGSNGLQSQFPVPRSVQYPGQLSTHFSKSTSSNPSSTLFPPAPQILIPLESQYCRVQSNSTDSTGSGMPI